MAITKRNIVGKYIYSRVFNFEDYKTFVRLQKECPHKQAVLYAANWLVKNHNNRGKIFHTEVLFLQKVIEKLESAPLTTAKSKRVISLFSMLVVEPFLERFSSRKKIRKRLKLAMKHAHSKNRTGTSITEGLPYTMKQLMKHLENQFQEGMTWKNYGIYDHCWNIDHIYPRSRLPYDSIDHPNFQKCWALNNLRPMWVKDNLAKGDSIPDDIFYLTTP